jgi:hypothetical protein
MGLTGTIAALAPLLLLVAVAVVMRIMQGLWEVLEVEAVEEV